jgi:hypothetical protein
MLAHVPGSALAGPARPAKAGPARDDGPDGEGLRLASPASGRGRPGRIRAAASGAADDPAADDLDLNSTL